MSEELQDWYDVIEEQGIEASFYQKLDAVKEMILFVYEADMIDEDELYNVGLEATRIQLEGGYLNIA